MTRCFAELLADTYIGITRRSTDSEAFFFFVVALLFFVAGVVGGGGIAVDGLLRNMAFFLFFFVFMGGRGGGRMILISLLTGAATRGAGDKETRGAAATAMASALVLTEAMAAEAVTALPLALGR